MIVEEMNILTTVFIKFDKEKIFYPNSVLATKPISNFYGSPDMSDQLDFSIDFKTPVEKIGALKDKMKRYIEKNPQLWHPNHSVIVKEIENVNKLKMALIFNHTMNFQDFGEKNKQQTQKRNCLGDEENLRRAGCRILSSSPRSSSYRVNNQQLNKK